MASQQRAPNALQWLRQNNYDDIAGQLARLEAIWKSQGKNTRRSWWEQLAGNPDGTPKEVYGEKIPVLHTARRRMGLADDVGAICRNPGEDFPPKLPMARWKHLKKKKKPKK